MPPGHIVGLTGLTVTVGIGFTVTLTVCVAIQPAAEVPVTVYVCEAPGLAVTLGPVVPLRPVLGAQVYVLAPPAFSVDEPPGHIEDGVAEAVTVGGGLIVIVTEAVLEQPPEVVPVTVYVCDDAGLAVTVAPVVALKPVAGLHVYVPPAPAPDPVRLTELPLQNVVGPEGFIVIVGGGVTVTTMLAVAGKQAPTAVPVTVYVVVDGGLATTEAPVVALNPVAGDHVNVVAVPEAFNVTLPPAQKVVEPPALTDTVGELP